MIRTLIAVHAGKKAYLDGLIRARYQHPGISAQFAFEWKQWSDGKYSVKIYRIEPANEIIFKSEDMICQNTLNFQTKE